MKQHIEILFDTCKEILTSPNSKKELTFQKFQEELSKDTTLKEGVTCILKAMEVAVTIESQAIQAAWKHDHDRLQVERLIIEKENIELKKQIEQLTHGKTID